MKELETIRALLENDRPEALDTLPDIELYMDQVVSYLPRQSVGGKVPSITSAMINNYVKDELLPRACGKRYHREHLIYLTAIGLLKNVLTVKDMKLLLDSEIQEGQEAEFYDRLLRDIDTSFGQVENSIAPDLPESKLADTAMYLALTSCAAKTACEHLLSVMREQIPPEEPKQKKDKEKDKDKDKEKEKEKDKDKEKKPKNKSAENTAAAGTAESGEPADES